MALGVVISFCGAKSRAFPSIDVPGLDPRIVPVIHVATSPAMPVLRTRRLHRSEPRSQKSRGSENFPLRKALKTHKNRKIQRE